MYILIAEFTVCCHKPCPSRIYDSVRLVLVLCKMLSGVFVSIWRHSICDVHSTKTYLAHGLLSLRYLPL